MGMSASQARLLSLTARMHDLEFQAQSVQYAKLDLVNSKNDVYEEYLEALDSTKYQMSVLTVNGNEFQDITYTNMISSQVNGLHSMYTITNATTGQVLLPEQIASKLGPDPHHKDPLREGLDPNIDDGSGKTHEEKLKEYLFRVGKQVLYPDGKDKNGRAIANNADAYINAMKSDGSYSYWKAQFYNELPEENDFLLVVAKNYLYSSRIDLEEDEDYLRQMKTDGNYDYWKAVYYQIAGYQSDSGEYVGGRGFCPISKENAVDRGWLEEALNSGEVQLFKLTKETNSFLGDKINIFAESSLGTDCEIQEVKNDELIALASVKYEKAVEDIDAKETKLDLQLNRIDAQHSALKTEYDSVKQIVSKNIDRSFKTFNA